MPNTTVYRFGRPAIIVSSEACHRQRPDVVLMAATRPAGLPKASLIRPVLITIERRLILRSWASCRSRTALRQALTAILG